MKNYDGSELTLDVDIELDDGERLEVEVTIQWADAQEQWEIVECDYPVGSPIRKLIEKEIDLQVLHPNEIQWE